jgi:hypothetical protein
MGAPLLRFTANPAAVLAIATACDFVEDYAPFGPGDHCEERGKHRKGLACRSNLTRSEEEVHTFTAKFQGSPRKEMQTLQEFEPSSTGGREHTGSRGRRFLDNRCHPAMFGIELREFGAKENQLR